MFHVLNDANNKKMADAETIDEALEKATELAEQHQQNYSIFELINRGTVKPKSRPAEPKEQANEPKSE